MRLPYRNKKVTLWVLFAIIVVTMFLFKFTELRPNCLFKLDATNDLASQMVRVEKYVTDDNQRVYSYNREMPLIFIGGVPRSGTTLMRAMLDAHPDVRCGQETRVIPRILQLRSHWLKSEKESLRLQEAGITKEVMNSAIAQFCLEIIAKHGEPAPRLCNKDPLTLKMGSYVIELFPNAKFLFMVRDGRATVHSIISRKVTITGFDLASYRQCMQKWNHAIELMHEQCRDIGKERCMMVYYEQLVLHPEEWMRKILKFLDVPWNDAVLHHEEFINKPNGVPLSKVERSSDQVIKPVNLEALSKWVDQIPGDVVHDMANIAPMLSVLGYDPYANPPDYGKPDAWVQDNTSKLKANRMLWESKAKQVLQMDTNPDEDNTNNNNNNNIEDNAIDNNNNNINKIMPQQQQHEEQQEEQEQQDLEQVREQEQEQERKKSQLLQPKQKPKDVITIKQLTSNSNSNNNHNNNIDNNSKKKSNNNGKQYVGAVEDT
ncbi:protein-tyrosine sulfotransferase isoform X1 [Drosophila innubila]|uniref:protein-tyrosine sulfotransferase isoform X1 n=1 Tax=Drosophila innubila TaxID=198719 RepID=UPI00148BEA28|nr:protein-tyrosine sulfotransferase isoform X1 [Drosophila innubila]